MKFDPDFRPQQGLTIQSSGALLAFRPNDDIVALASSNCHKFLGPQYAEGLLGLHVRDVVGSEVFHALRNVISLPSILRRREHIGVHKINGRAIDFSAFQSGSYVVSEISEADSDPMPTAYEVLKDVQLLQDRVLSANTEDEVFQNIVMLLRAISGYDCVAACKYDENLSHIVANAGNSLIASETLETNTQIHAVPDIRLGNVSIRSITDVNEFDISLSNLRCLPTPNVEKLQQIGAVACATQGIQIGKRIWGYLVFLHRLPRTPNHRTRLALSHLHPSISARLNAL